MAGTIQKFAFALVVALCGMALPPLAPLAAAQDLPRELNLEGTWELVERGERLDRQNPLVLIAHSGYTVTAEFLTGARCFDGQERIYAFVAELVRVPTVPPIWRLSSDDMWVCSGSPSIVTECAGRGVSSKYQTTFRNATAEPNLIKGKRARQVVNDCATQLESVAASEFTLTRVTCPVEARKVAEREAALRAILGSILGARDVFRAAVEAAQARYGETYNGLPTNTLAYPHAVVDWDWENAEEFFDALPAILGSPAWTSARAMAGEMAGELTLLVPNPLPAVVAMYKEIHRVELTAADGQRALVLLRNARRDLESCRQRALQR